MAPCLSIIFEGKWASHRIHVQNIMQRHERALDEIEQDEEIAFTLLFLKLERWSAVSRDNFRL